VAERLAASQEGLTSKEFVRSGSIGTVDKENWKLAHYSQSSVRSGPDFLSPSHG
jgi:hypothetical protein